MIVAKKDGREIRAMTLQTPVDRCLGVVQCALNGCEAHLPLVEGDGPLSEQIGWFLKHHECRAHRPASN